MRNKCKKVISIIMALALVASSAFWASAQTQERDVRINDEYIYEVMSDNTVTICYYVGNSVDVKVPNTIGGLPVKTIGDYAFCSSKVNNVNISNGIEYLGDYAFAYCKDLVSATFPASYKSAGQGVFRSCTNLETVNMGYSTRALSEYMFYGCTKLYDIGLSAYCKEIPKGAFSYCTSLDFIYLPNAVTEVKEYAFYGSGLESINIPYSLEYIHEKAFANCYNLYSITSDGNSFYYLADDAFENVPAELPWENIPPIEKPTSPTTTEFVESDPIETTIVGGVEPPYNTDPVESTTVGGIEPPPYNTDPVESTTVGGIEPPPGDSGGDDNQTDPVESSAATTPTEEFPTVVTPTEEPTMGPDPTEVVPSTAPSQKTITVYFENAVDWEDGYDFYVFCQLEKNSTDSVDIKMEYYYTTYRDTDIYKAEIPEDVYAIMFHDSVFENKTLFTTVCVDSHIYYCTDIQYSQGGFTRWNLDYYMISGDDLPGTDINEDGYYMGSNNNEMNEFENQTMDDFRNWINKNMEELTELAEPGYSAKGKRGDANTDGLVNVKDATAVQAYVADMPRNPFDEKLADADMDMKVTIKDATAIQKYIAGLIDW